MEAEIDIEEHDLFEDPRIKHMFPDITKVKSEVLDEDVVEVLDDDYIHSNDCLQYENNCDYNGYDSYNNVEEHTEVGNFTNKIILGSKPSTNVCEEEEAVKKEYLPAVVMLEDWGDRLNNSSCFCKDCKILFATNNALDYHKMAAHSFLIAITNKAVKSTTRNSTGRIKDVDKIEDGAVIPHGVDNKINDGKNKLCNHCNKYFADGNALIKHLYELLTTDDSNVEAKKSTKTTNFKYQCKICQKLFLSLPGSKIHIRIVHPDVNAKNNILKVSAGSEKITGAVKVATRNLSQINDSGTNINYWYSTRTFVTNSPIPQSVLYKCMDCSMHFVMALPAIHHTRYCSENTPYLRCNICKRKMRSHDILLHKLQHKVSTEFKIYQGSSRNYKRSLCKCPKCDVCYSERKFWPHYKECRGDRSNCDWCATCGEFINSSVITNHVNIHNLVDSDKSCFIIIKFATDVHSKVAENTVSVVKSKKRRFSTEFSDNVKPLKKMKKYYKKADKFHLYHCKLCNCCLHINQWVHHLTNNCRKAKSIVCQKCGLMFTQKSMKKHKELHKQYNVTLQDFHIFTKDGKRVCPRPPQFYHCQKCKVYFATKGQKRLHSCSEKYDVCHICSKRYNSCAFHLHMLFHSYGKSEKPVKPDTRGKPNFTDESICADDPNCIVKPDSVRKYKCLNKMWNILFLCESCGLNTDSYDEAVSHSQRHLIGSGETGDQERCRVCDLKFDDKCYKNHMKLHKQLPVNKNDFLILPYRYRALFKNQWFNLFGKLATKMIKQIISQSIYRDTRRAIMRVVENGQPEYTLYVCELCNVSVKSQDVNKHIRSCCTQIDYKFHCTYCGVNFNVIENYKRHERIHKKMDIKFRVVKFEPMTLPKLLDLHTNKISVANERFFNFYKCALCKLSVLGKGVQVMNHICCDGVPDTCRLCGIGYRSKYKNNHMRLHKKYPMLSRKTVKYKLFRPENENTMLGTTMETLKRPETINRDIQSENGKLVTSKIYLVTCKRCRLFFKSRRELSAHYPDCKAGMGHGHDETAHDVEEPPDEKDTWLYKCSECCCHFLHLKSLKMHKVTCRRTQRELRTCDVCGLKFTQNSLSRHMSKHHSKKKYSLKVLEPVTGETAVYNV